MLQFTFTAAARLAARGTVSDAERWRLDPLSHPVLGRMSQRELADLPIGHPQPPRKLGKGWR